MDDLNILCLLPNGFCANKCRVSFALFKTNAHARQGLYNSKQQATAFDHMCCYNQHRMKVSWPGFKKQHFSQKLYTQLCSSVSKCIPPYPFFQTQIITF